MVAAAILNSGKCQRLPNKQPSSLYSSVYIEHIFIKQIGVLNISTSHIDKLNYYVSGQFDISPSFSDGTWTHIKKVTTQMNSQHSNTPKKRYYMTS